MKQSDIKEVLQKVSSCMMHLDDQGTKEVFPVSLLDMQCWEWPQGVGLTGLVRYAIAENDTDILSFLVDWFDRHIKTLDTVERNVNTTSPILALSYLYDVCPKPEYLEAMRCWADWIMNPQGLIRTGDGCMQHMITGDPNPDQILIDTLFMTVLFLLRAGRLFNRPDMIAEANYQILVHIKYLYDTETGLFFHGWSFKRMNNYGKVHWLRGNSWFTVGSADFIMEQDGLSPEVRRMFEATLTRQIDALIQYQDPDIKLWHTVIDSPDSYIELSGSCAALCGIMKAVRSGLLQKESYIEAIRSGIAAALRYVDENGAVRNVSYGTPIGENKEFYMNIPCYIMTYGQAMMILMLQESLNPYWADIL